MAHVTWALRLVTWDWVFGCVHKYITRKSRRLKHTSDDIIIIYIYICLYIHTHQDPPMWPKRIGFSPEQLVVSQMLLWFIVWQATDLPANYFGLRDTEDQPCTVWLKRCTQSTHASCSQPKWASISVKCTMFKAIWDLVGYISHEISPSLSPFVDSLCNNHGFHDGIHMDIDEY